MESFDFARHDPGPLRLLCNYRYDNYRQGRRTVGLDPLDTLSLIARASVYWLCGPQVW